MGSGLWLREGLNHLQSGGETTVRHGPVDAGIIRSLMPALLTNNVWDFFVFCWVFFCFFVFLKKGKRKNLRLRL